MERDAASAWRRLLKTAAVDVEPLRRHRNFRLLFLSGAVALFGAMIRNVALPYQVYQLSHSSLAVGVLGPVEIVPILGLALLGGALADAHDRKRMVQITEVAFGLLSAVLLINALLPRPQLWLIYAVAAGMSAIDALQRPSLDALLPRLVDRDELVPAAALQSMRSTAVMILGPAAGGLLIAGVGLPATYGVELLTGAVAFPALLMMPAFPPPSDAERPGLRRVLEGLSYARSRPELMGTYLVDMVAMFFGMPLALFPALAAQYGGARALGLLYTAPAVGSFLVTATSGWSRHVRHHGRAVVLAAGAWGLAIVGFGLSHALALALLFLALAGGTDMVSGLFRSAIWNQTIPDALRGRLAGIEMVSYTTGPAFGDLESGVVATLFNVRISIVSGGVLCVLGTLGLALLLPAFWSYDQRAHLGVLAPPGSERPAERNV